MVCRCANWYIGFVDARCAAPNSDCLWSPLLHGFYEARNRNLAASAPENYCSITELKCLCHLIGPSGVRVIDLEVLKIVHAAMHQMKKVPDLGENAIFQYALDAQRGRVMDLEAVLRQLSTAYVSNELSSTITVLALDESEQDTVKSRLSAV